MDLGELLQAFLAQLRADAGDARQGRLVAEFARADATQDNVGAAMMSDQGNGAPEAQPTLVTGGTA